MSNEQQLGAEDECDQIDNNRSTSMPLGEEDSLHADLSEIIEDVISKIQMTIADATKEAISKLVMTSSDPHAFSKFECGQKTKYALHKAVRDTLHNGMRIGPANPQACLPYQDVLSDEIKHVIDTQELGLIALCNSGVAACSDATKYTLGSAIEACYIPSNALYPLDTRKLNARIDNTSVFDVRGDKAKHMSWKTLWAAVSPSVRNENKRFSMPTALMVLRMCGSRNVADTDSFLYFDTPQNNITSTNSDGKIVHCGPAFVTAKRLAEAWNAMVFRHHQSPPQNTDAHDSMVRDFITADMCKVAIAALSRIKQVNPVQFDKESELFFVVREGDQDITDASSKLLYSPVCTITDQDTLSIRLELNKAGTICQSHIADQSCKTQKIEKPSATATLDSLSRPEHFRWDSAKNDFRNVKRSAHNRKARAWRNQDDRHPSQARKW